MAVGLLLALPAAAAAAAAQAGAPAIASSAAGAAALAAGDEQARTATLAALGSRLLKDYAAPATHDFSMAAQAMPGLVAAACAAPPSAARPETEPGVQTEASALAALDRGFASLVAAWAPLELLRFGPLVQGNRFERLFFWPDPRGVVARQVQAALGARDEALLAPEALAAASVALQGIPALEFALYGGQGALLAPQGAHTEARPAPPADAAAAVPDPAAAGYRCALARAIATQLSATAQAVAGDWQRGGEFARLITQPGADNPLYRSPDEVAAEWVKAMSGGLQFQRDAKLVPALGTSPTSARAQRAPLARSGYTVVALASATDAVGRLFAAAQIAPALPAAQQGLADGVPRQAATLAVRLRDLDAPWASAVSEPQARARLREIDSGLRTLKSLIDEPVAGALGVQLGFNALDGD